MNPSVYDVVVGSVSVMPGQAACIRSRVMRGGDNPWSGLSRGMKADG
jgi:hypothetical protein